MKTIIIPVTPFQQNCTLLWCEATRKAAIIDPGGEADRILRAVEAQDVEPEKILLTHGHLDHVGGVADLVDRLGLPVEGPQRADAFLIEAVAQQALMFGVPAARSFVPDRWLEEGDRVTVGEIGFDVLHCPGHTPGHVVFVQPERRFALVGDVLFRGSVGRTDLPGGDHAALIRSIRQKLLPLGDDVTFLPGHGPASTIGAERASNPFIT
ncbi:MBL fold metallo-hydrolase [Arenibaculum pallidiluteum]|uniref:MBL fold metallo-hydrolase n=1 Tax=Arenibaculum pallidiluteum TaxID=2812559 RepID=UPI001A966768|nr:MBL fold metallo-hydrolase [Arenibaculum pallidiluteum]